MAIKKIILFTLTSILLSAGFIGTANNIWATNHTCTHPGCNYTTDRESILAKHIRTHTIDYSLKRKRNPTEKKNKETPRSPLKRSKATSDIHITNGYAGSDHKDIPSSDLIGFNGLPFELQEDIFEKAGLPAFETFERVSTDWRKAVNKIGPPVLKKQFTKEERKIARDILAIKFNIPRVQVSWKKIYTLLTQDEEGKIIRILALAMQGKVMGSEFVVGDMSDNIRKAWGESKDKNRYYMSYPNGIEFICNQRDVVDFISYHNNLNITPSKIEEMLKPFKLSEYSVFCTDDENYRVCEYVAGNYKIKFWFSNIGKYMVYKEWY